MFLMGFVITEEIDEQGASTGGYEKGRVCVGVGCIAEELGCAGAILRGVGDLSLEGVAGEPGSDLCFPVERMVGAGDAAVE
jgi:hypothetical protein